MNKKIKILVVEDEDSMRQLIQARVEFEGYDVDTCEDGELAIEYLNTSKLPDLILLDIMMPNMNGYEVCKWIRENEKTRNVPVVFLTALGDDDHKIMGHDAGNDDYLVKPFNPNELVARIKSLLRINFYRSMLDEREKLHAAVSDLSEGIIICDKKWVPTLVNNSASNWITKNIANTETINILDVIFDNFEVSKPRIEIEKQTEESGFIEIAKGHELILSARITPIKNPLGELTSRVITLRNITELECANRLKHSILDVAGHKLKAPISLIRTVSKMLYADAGLNKTAKAMPVQMLGEVADYLEVIHERMLMLFMLKMEEMCLNENGVDIIEYLEKISGYESFKNVKFTLNPQDEIPKIMINPKYLDIIFYNLIDNTVKFNDKDEPEIIVTLNKTSNNRLVIRFEDNGPGMEFDNTLHMFTALRTSTGTYAGVSAGLGLWMVKEVIETLKGQFDLVSIPGESAAFEFTLPALRN